MKALDLIEFLVKAVKENGEDTEVFIEMFNEEDWFEIVSYDSILEVDLTTREIIENQTNDHNDFIKDTNSKEFSVQLPKRIVYPPVTDKPFVVITPED